MSRKRVLFVVLVASMVVLAAGVQAQPAANEGAAPGLTVPYPGRLTDATGRQVSDGSYDFIFALYDSQVGGEPLWSEVQENVMVQAGTFSVSLGSKEPLAQDLLASGVGWLSVRVRGPGESEFTTLTPRQRLTAAPTMPEEPSSDQACPHDHFGEQWSGTGVDGLWLSSGNQTGLVAWSTSHVGAIGISTPYSFVWPSERKFGLYGYSYSDHGVYGRTYGDWGWISGVYGEAAKSNAIGVTGWNTGDGIGVYGHSESGKAGHFSGPVEVIGYLTKSGGGFKIDHPVDPANKYLSHSFVESPDMKNVYDGTVILDANGEAWVDLPEWFEALNEDFRYQLTCIGGFAPVYIAQEIQDNRFQIAGGTPGLKVSWQVTGIRHDAYAEAHRFPVEEDKPEEEQGTYLHPVEQGMPETLGLDYQQTRAREEP
jgi:hypothetical protein